MGHGSFSTVCQAMDTFTGDKVFNWKLQSPCPILLLLLRSCKLQYYTQCTKLADSLRCAMYALFSNVRTQPPAGMLHSTHLHPDMQPAYHVLCWHGIQGVLIGLLRTQVALKRIPDVLSSPDQAKKVLREVCILRRLRHPFLINLLDAFTRPASSGMQTQSVQLTCSSLLAL